MGKTTVARNDNVKMYKGSSKYSKYSKYFLENDKNKIYNNSWKFFKYWEHWELLGGCYSKDWVDNKNVSAWNIGALENTKKNGRKIIMWWYRRALQDSWACAVNKGSRSAHINEK